MRQLLDLLSAVCYNKKSPETGRCRLGWKQVPDSDFTVKKFEKSEEKTWTTIRKNSS